MIHSFKPTIIKLIEKEFSPQKIPNLPVLNPTIQELIDHEFWLLMHQQQIEDEESAKIRPYGFNSIPSDESD
jgi:hypothetical protein